MVDRTLTAANSVYMLGIAGIFSAAQQLQGFEVDEAFSTSAIKSAETKMGLDAFLSAGWVPTEKPQEITLQADSASNDIFDTWASTQEAAQELSVAFGIIILPGLGRKYVLTRGFLTAYTPIPNVKKILQARTYGITWQTILPAPF